MEFATILQTLFGFVQGAIRVLEAVALALAHLGVV